MDATQANSISIAQNKQQIEDHHGQLKNLWAAVEKVRDRPPVWVSWVLAGAGFVIGIMSTLLVQCIPPMK